MEAFFLAHWAEILLSLVTAGALAFCRYTFKQIKNYKKLLEEQDKNDIASLIKTEIAPIVEDIQHLNEVVEQMKVAHEKQIGAIVQSYKFRLIQLCRIYLDQKFMTTDQYEQLSEFYRLYTELGGNGQAQEYYELTIKLPIHDEEEK